MIDFGLKPCPLCGGKARVEWLREGREVMDAVISCVSCGLRLEWYTDFVTARPFDTYREGAIIIKRGLDPFEAWNRRAKHDEPRSRETD